jgi:hypothetical protein
MPALNRDEPLSTEDHTLLPKSEKHVSFHPDLPYHEIEDIRSQQKKRVTRKLHILGLLSLFLGLLFYFHAWRVSVSISDLAIVLTGPSILSITDTA